VRGFKIIVDYYSGKALGIGVKPWLNTYILDFKYLNYSLEVD
jgi:hypothetical protein